MSLEALNAERLSIMDELETLNEETAKIRNQLNEATEVRAKTGQYANSDWWRRATFALKAMNREKVGLQNRLGDVNRQIRSLTHDERSKVFEQHFIAVAKR